MNDVERIYGMGFVRKCAEAGVSPAALLKTAWQINPARGAEWSRAFPNLAKDLMRGLEGTGATIESELGNLAGHIKSMGPQIRNLRGEKAFSNVIRDYVTGRKGIPVKAAPGPKAGPAGGWKSPEPVDIDIPGAPPRPPAPSGPTPRPPGPGGDYDGVPLPREEESGGPGLLGRYWELLKGGKGGLNGSAAEAESMRAQLTRLYTGLSGGGGAYGAYNWFNKADDPGIE